MILLNINFAQVKPDVHDVNRSGSKRSGCPRPASSSAYPFYLWFY